MQRRRITVVAPSVVAPDAPTLDSPAEATDVYDGVAVAWTASVTAGQVPDAIQLVLDAGTGGETVVDTDTTSTYGGNWTPSGVSAGAHTLVARFVYGSGSVDSAATNIVLFDATQVAENLVAWYDATTGTTLAAAKVSTWAPREGSGGATWNASQASDAARPTLQATASRTGGPALEFKLAGAATRLDTGAGAVIAAAPFSIVALAKRQDVATAGQRLWDSLAVSNEATIYDTTGTNIKCFAPAAEITSSSSYSAGNWYTLMGVYNAASSVMRVDDDEDAGTVGTAAISAGFRIGAMGGNPTGTFWDGEVRHLMVYDEALSAGSRNRLAAWLATQ